MFTRGYLWRVFKLRQLSGPEKVSFLSEWEEERQRLLFTWSFIIHSKPSRSCVKRTRRTTISMRNGGAKQTFYSPSGSSFLDVVEVVESCLMILRVHRFPGVLVSPDSVANGTQLHICFQRSPSTTLGSKPNLSWSTPGETSDITWHSGRGER